MRIEDTLIIELCKSKKNRDLIQTIISGHDINLNYLINIIENHLIKPAILVELLNYRRSEEFTDKILTLSKNSVIETTLRNKMICKELTGIRETLQHNAIEFIVMKGLTLDFSGLRSIGDIDILIKEENLLKASKALQGVRYEYVGDILNYNIKKKERNDIVSQLSWNNQFQFYKEENSLLVELHTNLFERSRVHHFNLDRLLDSIDCFWNNKQYDEKLQCYKFSDPDQLICMCLHNALKRALYRNTFILRNLMDIDNLINAGMDWDFFMPSAIKYDVASFALFSLTLANRVLETPVPPGVMNELASHCSKWQIGLTNLHLKCFINLESSSLFFSNVYKIFVPFIYQEKWAPRIKSVLLFHVLFPSRWFMAEQFHLDRDNPLVYFTYLLNPLRWIYILARNLLGKFFI